MSEPCEPRVYPPSRRVTWKQFDMQATWWGQVRKASVFLKLHFLIISPRSEKEVSLPLITCGEGGLHFCFLWPWLLGAAQHSHWSHFSVNIGLYFFLFGRLWDSLTHMPIGNLYWSEQLDHTGGHIPILLHACLWESRNSIMVQC